MPTDSTPPSFMPGLDFLKGLAAQAGKGLSGSLPGLGSLQQWVAPVLDPEELDKKIEELRTVHFWLEQNAKLLAATIQALEVQKMTLNTLRSMNVPFPDLKAAAPSPEPAPAKRSDPPKAAKAAPASKKPDSPAPDGAAEAVKWWGALTEQFTQIASQALAQVSATADRAGSAGMAAAQSALDKAGGAGAAARSAASARSEDPASAARARRGAPAKTARAAATTPSTGTPTRAASAKPRTSKGPKARAGTGRGTGVPGRGSED